MPRRFGLLATLLSVTLSVSVLTAGPVSAAANPKKFGPRVVYIKGMKLIARQAGKPDQTLRMSEFRVRGNSSRKWPKKPYGVVFSKPTSLFGLPAGKGFRLQANYHDRSLLRNRVSYQLARKMKGMAWNPRSVFAELVVNGKYVGSYQVIEEIEIGPNRVDISPKRGLIAEFDKRATATDQDGMRHKAEVPKNSKRLNPMLSKHVNPFLSAIDSNGDWNDYVDTRSFVDFYLVKEFTKDSSADFLFSNHYYTPDVKSSKAKIYMGPVWDFDRSAGNEKGVWKHTVWKPTGWWVRYHDTTKVDRGAHMPWARDNWYNKLVERKTFQKKLCSRWKQKRSVFRDVSKGGVQEAIRALGGARVASNDRAVWKKSNVDRPPRRGPRWDDEVTYLRQWYAKRYAWMNKHIC